MKAYYLFALITMVSGHPQNRFRLSADPLSSFSGFRSGEILPQLFQTDDGRVFALRSSQVAFQPKTQTLYETSDGRVFSLRSEELDNEWKDEREIVLQNDENDDQVVRNFQDESNWKYDKKTKVEEGIARRPAVDTRYGIVNNEGYDVESPLSLRLFSPVTTKSKLLKAKKGSQASSIDRNPSVFFNPVRTRNNPLRTRKIPQSPAFSLSGSTSSGYYTFPSAGIAYNY